MAVMKKKRKGGIPPISTASLPDVIFMILFFFMISTSMREMEVLVKTQLPNATEVSKLEKKQLVSYVYIGVPNTEQHRVFSSTTRSGNLKTFWTSSPPSGTNSPKMTVWP